MAKEHGYRLQQCLGISSMLTVERSFETNLFRHFANHVFRNLYFQKYISYDGHLFLEHVQNIMQFPENQRNIEKRLFAS